MKLRIARKMDLGDWKRRERDNRANHKRPWWTVYNGDQLLRAERRLSRSWRTHVVRTVDDEGRKWLTVGDVPDFFVFNRVHSRRIRRGALRRNRPEKYA